MQRSSLLSMHSSSSRRTGCNAFGDWCIGEPNLGFVPREPLHNKGAESSLFVRGPVHYAVVYSCFVYDFVAWSLSCVFPVRFRTNVFGVLTVFRYYFVPNVA